MVRQLYERLNEGLMNLSDAVFRKIATKTLTYYCPERVFAYIELQKTQMRVTLFTRGEPIPGVKGFQYERGGARWGRIVVRSESDLPRFLEAAKISLDRIREAIRANEPTGWFATAEEEEEAETDAASEADEGEGEVTEEKG